MEATIKAGYGKMRAEIKICMEETEATESADNEEKIQMVKSIHVLTDLQGRASDVLQGIPKEETY